MLLVVALQIPSNPFPGATEITCAQLRSDCDGADCREGERESSLVFFSLWANGIQLLYHNHTVSCDLEFPGCLMDLWSFVPQQPNIIAESKSNMKHPIQIYITRQQSDIRARMWWNLQPQMCLGSVLLAFGTSDVMSVPFPVMHSYGNFQFFLNTFGAGFTKSLGCSGGAGYYPASVCSSWGALEVPGGCYGHHHDMI